MFIDRLLPIAATRLVSIAGDAPTIEAAKLLLERRTDIVAVVRADGVLSGVLTKTDIVRQMSQCCKTACKTFQIPGVNSVQKFPPWSVR